MNDITDEIVNDIKSVAEKLKVKKLSRSEYSKHGKFNSYQLYDEGNNWTDLCKKAGLETKEKIPVSDEEYFNTLKLAYNTLGRYPTAMERKKYKLNMSKRRFATLPEFIKEAARLGYVPDYFKEEKIEKQIEDENTIIKLVSKALNSTDRKIPPIPINTPRKKWERINLDGFPYAPQEEQGVLAIFSIFCSQKVLPWQIIDISTNGIDCICYDESNLSEIRVELKYLLSKGSWNHNIADLDYLVCWENRWHDFPKPVIELSKMVKF